MRRLKETIGKSRGAIFHHFGDKENLFLALAREDAARMAEVVAANGLVEVMRDMLKHPERHDWLATRLEITKMLRTDPTLLDSPSSSFFSVIFSSSLDFLSKNNKKYGGNMQESNLQENF